MLWTYIFPWCIIRDNCINKDGSNKIPIRSISISFRYYHLFQKSTKIPKQSLHCQGSAFKSKLQTRKNRCFWFLIFLNITVSKHFKINSKHFNYLVNKIKQFSCFPRIIAIMKICDHSEVIWKMIILKTNAWQKATRITQNQIFTKS